MSGSTTLGAQGCVGDAARFCVLPGTKDPTKDKTHPLMLLCYSGSSREEAEEEHEEEE